MRRFLLLNTFCAIALSAVSASPAMAQAQSKTKGAESKATEKAAEKKSETPAATESRRVPQYFAQVDLTEEQREKIYAVRAKHSAKQDQLEAQLEEIRATILRESEAVLTPSQKTALAKLRSEAKAKAKAKTKAATKK